jgi:hypothetical protein
MFDTEVMSTPSDSTSENPEYSVYAIVDPTKASRPLFIGMGRDADVVAMLNAFEEAAKLPPEERWAHALVGAAPLLAFDAKRGHYGLGETIAFLFGNGPKAGADSDAATN